MNTSIQNVKWLYTKRMKKGDNMEIKLISLKLKQFKGIDKLSVLFDGKDTTIYGDNHRGKTSIYDAWSWVMFDKNSLGDSSFQVKPFGVERPEVEVECVLTIDGKEITLKKQLVESWVKKRGDETETLSGNTTSYWINGIPKKAGEYKAFIDSIVTEDTFKRLTNASYFLSMKKADMRRVLVDMASNIPDMEIAGDDTDLVNLVMEMQERGYSIDDLLKLAKQNITLYNSEQNGINPRIDEVNQSIPEEQDYAHLEEGLQKGIEYVGMIDRTLSEGMGEATDLSALYKERNELQNSMESYKKNRLSLANEERNKNVVLKGQIETHKAKLDGEIAVLEQRKNNLTRQIKDSSELLISYAEQYREYAKKKKDNASLVFEPIAEGSANCDKCGQILPVEMIADMNAKALEKFNADRKHVDEHCTTNMNNIGAEGSREKANKTLLELKLNETSESLEKLLTEQTMANSQIIVLKNKLETTLEATDIDLSNDTEYSDMMNRIAEINEQLVKPTDDKKDKLLANKANVIAQMDDIKAKLALKDVKEKAEKRIAELVARGKELAGLILAEKSIQYQCERFIQKKAKALESSINAMFENLSFRLFEVQLNEGIKDDCTPMINGVEYKDASYSERIRANLDIVNAMQKSANVFCPVWVDNSESATYLRQMPCQLIKLCVSEQDKTLRIERSE